MGDVIELPAGVFAGSTLERTALRSAVVPLRTAAPRLRLMRGRRLKGPAYCASCAAPIEFGAVTRELKTYCSIECSLGGDPA